MKKLPAGAVTTAVMIGVLAACSGPARRSPAPAAADPSATRASASAATDPAASSASAPDVVAEVNGAPITAGELNQKASSRLAQLRQQEYEIRRQALDELIADRLIAAEARKRGISPDELLRREVDARVEPPPPGQVESIYEQAKDRFPGQTREQAQKRIRELLDQRAQAERRAAFEQELRDAAKVTIRLEAPRVAIAIPKGAPATGPASAPVTIVEFTDYQCPFCHRAQGVMDTILARYKGRVRLVHLDFPLPGHPGAMPAARAAHCAGDQGKFWEYHHNLMTTPGAFDQTDLTGRAAALGLERGAFASCLASGRHDAAIEASVTEGEGVGVNATPTYFINGRMLSGARPFEAFAEVIDAELASR
jgi:protein-disulfide isomerase